ncbi:MAG: hypothetical protein QW356_07675 [Candidatus Hadarchaeales archaeon]
MLCYVGLSNYDGEDYDNLYIRVEWVRLFREDGSEVPTEYWSLEVDPPLKEYKAGEFGEFSVMANLILPVLPAENSPSNVPPVPPPGLENLVDEYLYVGGNRWIPLKRIYLKITPSPNLPPADYQLRVEFSGQSTIFTETGSRGSAARECVMVLKVLGAPPLIPTPVTLTVIVIAVVCFLLLLLRRVARAKRLRI